MQWNGYSKWYLRDKCSPVEVAYSVANKQLGQTSRWDVEVWWSQNGIGIGGCCLASSFPHWVGAGSCYSLIAASRYVSANAWEEISIRWIPVAVRSSSFLGHCWDEQVYLAALFSIDAQPCEKRTHSFPQTLSVATTSCKNVEALTKKQPVLFQIAASHRSVR